MSDPWLLCMALQSPPSSLPLLRAGLLAMQAKAAVDGLEHVVRVCSHHIVPRLPTPSTPPQYSHRSVPSTGGPNVVTGMRSKNR